MDEKVSIIIPVYNSAKWLNKCLYSVVNQTYKNTEIICINDGSTDNSLDILNEYKDKYNNIIVFNKDNEGVSKTRNIGLQNATGKYIMFVDSDDWIEPNMCELLLGKYQSTSAQLVLCGLNIFKNDILLRTPNVGDFVANLDKIEDYFYLRRINCGPCNKLFCKEYINTRFDSSLSNGEDLLFVINYMRNINNVIAVKDCLYNVRLDNQNSLNRKMRFEKVLSCIKVFNEEIKYLIFKYGESKTLNEQISLSVNSILALIVAYRMSVTKKEFVKNMNLLFGNKDFIKLLNYNIVSNKKYALLYKLLKGRKTKIVSFWGYCLGFLKKIIR